MPIDRPQYEGEREERGQLVPAPETKPEGVDSCEYPALRSAARLGPRLPVPVWQRATQS